MFQQLADPDGQAEEVRIGRIICTLDTGSFNFAGLVEGEQAGTIHVTSQTDDFDTLLSIWYAGVEEGSTRHVFDTQYARFYISNDTDAIGATIEVEMTAKVRRELVWDCQFTLPLYQPPPAGSAVTDRIEIFSEEWRSSPYPPMHVIRNSSQQVEP